ncbi:MAG: hypothetical protein JWP97_1300 [Labilithrix sp.]|nr:hypothetical protein [Labilithrix sp.]
MADASPSRRRFLKTGLVGGLVLAFGGGLAFYPSAHVASPTRALAVLDDQSFQVLVAVAQRIVTPAGADHVAIAHGVDMALQRLPVESQHDMVKLLGLLENALPGLVLDQRISPFTRLSPEGRDKVLDSWATSRITVRRTGYQALRKLCLAAHYAEETSWPPLHYEPPSGLSAMAYDDSQAGTPEWLAAQAQGDAP